MAKPPTGPQEMVVGCHACGWRLKVDVIVRFEGETETHWLMSSAFTVESKAFLEATRQAHHGPVSYFRPSPEGLREFDPASMS